MAKQTHQQRIEARWGQPLWDLLRDFAEQGMNRHQTAHALGIQPAVFHNLLARYHERDPFPPVVGIPTQYTLDTGESFRAACLRMAATHTITEACREIGYAHINPFKYAMRVRGIEVEFRSRADKAKKPMSQRRQYSYATDETALQYAEQRINGARDEVAAATVGVGSSALRRRLQKHFPKRWKEVVAATRDYRRRYHNHKVARR